MARRTKLNADVQRRIIQAIQEGATYELAAQFGGITRTTLYYWLKKGEEIKEEQEQVEQYEAVGEEDPLLTFFNEFKKAEAICCVGALAVIKKEARTGTWQAAAWLLERRFPQQYARNQQPAVQLTIDVDAEEINVKGWAQEYKTYVQPLIEGPIIDLDEE